MREVFFDWDCTITQSHMYSMFNSSNLSSKSEMGRFLSQYPKEDRLVKLQIMKNVVDRFQELYNFWGSNDDESLCILQAGLKDTSSFLTKEEYDIIGSDLCTFLFGDKERQDTLTNMIASIQGNGQVVTILTKGIGACVLQALRCFLPHWIGFHGCDSTSNTGSSISSDNEILNCVCIIDYAGLCWHAGEVTRATAPLVPKLGQISVLLATRATQDAARSTSRASDLLQQALLIDDSAQHEIEGLDTEDVCTALKWPVKHVIFDNTSVRGRDTSVIRKYGTVIDVIAGGPKRNGPGIATEDCVAILNLTQL